MSPASFVPTEWIVASFTALASVIGALWLFAKGAVKRQEDLADAQQKKLDDCEERHHETNGVVTRLSERVGRLEGRREAIDEVSTVVVDAVKRGIRESQSG